MGYNTGVLILNDAMHLIKKNPVQFVENMLRAADKRWGSPTDTNVDFSIDYYVNAGSIFHFAHADTVGVYSIGGNYANRLVSSYNGGKHYSDEDKVELLKLIAQTLGYNIVKKEDVIKS